MKKYMKRFMNFMKLIHMRTILLILALYFTMCFVCFIVLKVNGENTPFFDIVVFNLLAVIGNDYMYVDNVWTRLAGIFILALGMVGLSTITGYVSSAFVARRLNLERGVKKMQGMKNHIIICGWKNDIKILIQGILRKNKELKVSDIILVSSVDDSKTEPLRDDKELAGLNILKGDYTEEQTLLKANAKEASKVLIIGENLENLDEELVDSRVFVGTLLVRKLNPKCHICAEIKTERYKNYLESQNCAEVIYVDEYTRYILSTSTNYGGMSKVMSSFLDNGDGVSVQIAPISDKWIGKKYGELFEWYKKEQNILLLGVLENMGVERELKHQILSEAQKSTNYGEIIQRIKSVKSMETNCPHLNPGDDYVLDKNMGAIILGDEV